MVCKTIIVGPAQESGRSPTDTRRDGLPIFPHETSIPWTVAERVKFS